MRILMVGTEAVPYAKTGGLADVLGALPLALARLGHTVDLVMPRYRGIEAPRLGVIRVPLRAGVVDTVVSAVTPAAGVRVVFIDHPSFFDRDGLYGTAAGDYPDNPARFAFLARAALEFAARAPERYALAHVHDWQTGLVPVLLAGERAADPRLGGLPTVFTIHNLAYQGIFEPTWLATLGLDPTLMRADALEYWGRISYLKAGLVFSRLLTTVSPRYAQEVQTPALGFGFDGLLRSRSSDLVGIVNGIDYDQWNPAGDVHLPEPFSASNLRGKGTAKRAVLDRFGMPGSDAVLARPLVAMISRLVDQKGFDLMGAVADRFPELDATVVLLGTGEARYEESWRQLANRHPDRVGVRIGFDEGLAHLIEGGADIFLMPSQFEPCGLNQMYSLRYGTVPVVRATGGLRDTVRQYDARTGEGTGFTFDAYTSDALWEALVQAVTVFADRTAWGRIQQAGMREDFSWDASARRYAEVYRRVVGP